MTPDQRPQSPPREPVNDNWPDVKTENPRYTDRTKDAYPLPGKSRDEDGKPRA